MENIEVTTGESNTCANIRVLAEEMGKFRNAYMQGIVISYFGRNRVFV